MSRHDPFGQRLPLLPMKEVVIFPRNIVTLFIGKPRSVLAVEEALATDQRLVIAMQRSGGGEEVTIDSIHRVGTLVEIVSFERRDPSGIQIVLEGIARVRLSQVEQGIGVATAAAERLAESPVDPVEAEPMLTVIKDLTVRYRDEKGVPSSEVLDMVKRASEPGQLADLLATQLLAGPEDGKTIERQALLEQVDPLQRLQTLAMRIRNEIDGAAAVRLVTERLRDKADQEHQKTIIKRQIEELQKLLDPEEGNEFDQFRRRVLERGMPKSIEDKLLGELRRLEGMQPVSAEATVVRTYLDNVLALPWHEETVDQNDLARAEAILNGHHYGLESVKERILDFLAVRALRARTGRGGSSAILCLVGPPGVGKTSLGQSIAEAMDRKFETVSLGGVRDEAEIRGHRKTYIGAMPGRVIKAMSQAKTINPVILLDEIDKLAQDQRGDPSSALLEVLDPNQNRTFTDHYLEAPYDLSKVLFIATANYKQQIPRPLLDRMEIIDLSGYYEDEKVEIGRQHLLARQIHANSLGDDDLQMTDEVLRRVVREYTREAGVRGLERELATICRKAASGVFKEGHTPPVTIDDELLEEYLGPPRYLVGEALNGAEIGVAMGLGTTEVGGELIQVEVVTMPGRGQLKITGNAGDVMQESAQAALTYARTRSAHLGIDIDFQDKVDLHIHLPQGAMPKDGPSAGITMAIALISALTNRPVRADTAMTGEITLRGHVLAIGGLRDKALAAHRSGLTRLIAPKENEREYDQLPARVREEISFFFVKSMDEVIAESLLPKDSTTVADEDQVVSTAMSRM
jgi:ATP-dependent Lon protease